MWRYRGLSDGSFEWITARHEFKDHCAIFTFWPWPHSRQIITPRLTCGIALYTMYIGEITPLTQAHRTSVLSSSNVANSYLRKTSKRFNPCGD